MKQARRSVICALLLVLLFSHQALADEQYANAMRLYKTKQYRSAAREFEHLLQTDTTNSNAAYYAALCYHFAGNYSQAGALYKTITNRFPGTQAATLSMRALKNLDSFGKLDSKLDKSQLLTAPKETWIPFEHQGQSLLIDGTINGVSTKMIFDTGASQTVFDRSTIKALKIDLPKGAPDAMAYGFGDGKPIRAWKLSTDIKIGNIRRQNYPIFVQETALGTPLLGETFFNDFEYAVDNSAKIISFKKRAEHLSIKNVPYETAKAGAGAPVTVNSSGQYVYRIPFERQANEMIVQAQVNGKTLPMIFDTGAEVTMFPPSALKKLGIVIPRHSLRVIGRGAAGLASTTVFQLDKMKVGPVEKGPLVVALSDGTPAPLLGQTFFKDWNYTIKNNSQVIEFVKK